MGEARPWALTFRLGFEDYGPECSDLRQGSRIKALDVQIWVRVRRIGPWRQTFGLRFGQGLAASAAQGSDFHKII
jgi:hypothetical protein